MYDRSVTVDEIMFRYFVKYDRLDQLIPYAFEGSDDIVLNIFIDLYGLYHTLYSRQYRTNVIDYTSFTVILINMCAHYRTYFKSLGVHTKIFLVSSFNTPKSTLDIIPEYNKTMVDKLKNNVVSEMMNLNLGLLDILCPYLPDIFFIKTEFESTVVINEVIDRENINHSIPSLIISTDMFPLQLCAYRPNVSFLWPRKAYDGDMSIICPSNTSKTFQNDFWGVVTRKSGNSMSYEKVGMISPSNLMLLLALNHYKDRDFPIITNVTKASRLISQTIGYDSIKLSPQTVFELNKPSDTKNMDWGLIEKRYQALDIQYQSFLFKESLENSTLHYTNLEDPEAIRMINDQYFSNNPIDIFRL